MNNGLVFDIGLHKGEDTAFYLSRGHRVIAFEANPRLVQECRARFAEALRSGDLTICSGVLRSGAAPATDIFYVDRDHSDWGSASTAFRDRNARAFHAVSDPIRLPVIRLQDVIMTVGVPLYAKIDVEGLDHEILRGFGDFPEPPRFVSIESVKTSWDALESEIELLASLGYRRFKAVQQRTIPGSSLRGHRFERHASGPFGDDLSDWTNRTAVLAHYRRIFRDYATWGDDSKLQRTLGRKPIAALQILAGRPLPGWYDTHARLD